MAHGIGRPRQTMRLGGALLAVLAVLVSLIAPASAQNTTSQGTPAAVTSEFCINKSLGGPATYPFDSNGDGVADVCSLPRTRRATAARQNTMEQLATELSGLFGYFFADECLKVSETFGEPEAERTDECAAPRRANAANDIVPPVPFSPAPEPSTDSRYYSGPLVTSPSFCVNDSFGGQITYPYDVNGDGIYDICVLPTTRRAAIARQNALERMATEIKARFDTLFAEECLRVPATLGEPVREATDECAAHRGSGNALPNPGGTPGTPGTPYTPPLIQPTADRPQTYDDRAAQNVYLEPRDRRIIVTWDPPTRYAASVFKYLVQWKTSRQGWSTTDRQGDAGTDTTHTISNLTNFTTYSVRVLALRGTSSDRYTPVLTMTPGLAGPPTWPDQGALTTSSYGEIVADWDAPRSVSSVDPPPPSIDITSYRVQWDTNSGFARDCIRDASCNEILLSGTTTTHTIKGLSTGTHYVRVQGISANGFGTWSLTASLRLTSTRPDPGQPTGLTLTTSGTGTELTATWTAPQVTTADPAPNQYLVQWRSRTANQNWSATSRQKKITKIGSNLATTITITGLVPRAEYEVRVQAINVDTPGSWSSTARIYLSKASPPTNFVQIPGDGEITVKWKKPGGTPAVTGYFLQWATRCSNSSFSSARQQIIQSTASDITRTIDNLANNVVYYLRVRSTNPNGFSDWTPCLSAEPGTYVAPSVDTVAAVTDTTDKDRFGKLTAWLVIHNRIEQACGHRLPDRIAAQRHHELELQGRRSFAWLLHHHKSGLRHNL